VSIISPYQHLAKVYREQGQLQRSYSFIKERRWLQIRSEGQLNVLQKAIDILFSASFGFGYSPLRALGSLTLPMLLSIGLVEWATFYSADTNQSGVREITSTKTKLITNSSVYKFETCPSIRVAKGNPTGSCEIRKASQVEKMDGPTLLAPRSPQCRRAFCDYSERSEASSCQIPERKLSGEVVVEALKIIFPLTRFQSGVGCSIKNDNHILRFFHGSLEGISWIVFPLAAITFTGVLREKSDA
jgi:hypothetical protein